LQKHKAKQNQASSSELDRSFGGLLRSGAEHSSHQKHNQIMATSVRAVCACTLSAFPETESTIFKVKRKSHFQIPFWILYDTSTVHFRARVPNWALRHSNCIIELNLVIWNRNSPSIGSRCLHGNREWCNGSAQVRCFPRRGESNELQGALFIKIF